LSLSGCASLTETATQVLRSSGAGEARRLFESGSRPADYVQALARFCDPETRDLLLEEFGELPATLVDTVIGAWLLAERSEKAFTLRSSAPERPLDFARSRRTRFTIDVEDDGVVVTLSHVPGRHAAWARPFAVAV